MIDDMIRRLAVVIIICQFVNLSICQFAMAQDMQSLSLRKGNMEMSVINYGARIQALKFAGQDMVLGFDTLSHYAQKKQNFGAIVGRYIGRIISGKLPCSYLNANPNHNRKKSTCKRKGFSHFSAQESEAGCNAARCPLRLQCRSIFRLHRPYLRRPWRKHQRPEGNSN